MHRFERERESWRADTSRVGPHSYVVTAISEDGQAATATIHYTVIGPPSVSISGPAMALSGEPVTFSAIASPDPNSTLDDYAWDFDGSNSFSNDAALATSVTHVFQTPGVYVVDVRVRETAGLTASAHVTVDVRPAPPPGNVGVSINNGDYATNNPRVQVDLIWPQFATQALISNDGGFGAAGGTITRALAAQVPWTLEQTGAERLPKTVYVRFLGAGIDTQNFTDDTILDQTLPTLQSAQLVGGAGASAASTASAKPKAHSYRIKIKAQDKIVGVCAVDASAKKSGGTVETVKSCHGKGILSLAKTVPARFCCRCDRGRARLRAQRRRRRVDRLATSSARTRPQDQVTRCRRRSTDFLHREPCGGVRAFRRERPLGSLAVSQPLNKSTPVGRTREPRTVVVGAMVSNAERDAVEQFAAKRGWTLRVITDALAVHVSTTGFLDDEDASTPPQKGHHDHDPRRRKRHREAECRPPARAGGRDHR